MSRFRNEGYGNSDVRIDARPKNSVSSQAGIRNAHYGMGGRLIGGYAEGRGFGTKANGGRGESMPSASTDTAPATGNRLEQRKSLFRNMEKAGANGMTDDMRTQARRLGVGDEAFNAATGRIKSNAAAIAPAIPSQAAAQQTSQAAAQRPQPVANAEPKTQWEMDRFRRVQKQNEMRANGVNPQTGLARGADAPANSPENGKPAAPKYGADIAKANIQSMGQEGAALDYFQRAAAEKEQVAAKQSADTQSKFRESAAITTPNSVSKPSPMPASPFPSPAAPKVAMPDVKAIAGKVAGGVSALASKAVGAVNSGIGAVSSAMATMPQPKPVSKFRKPEMSPAATTAKEGMGNPSNDTLQSPESVASEQWAGYKQQAKDLIAKDMQAEKERGQRIAKAKANVTAPAWMEGSVAESATKGIKRMAANFTR